MMLILAVDWEPGLIDSDDDIPRVYILTPGRICHVLDNREGAEKHWFCKFRIGRTCISPTEHECLYREGD